MKEEFMKVPEKNMMLSIFLLAALLGPMSVSAQSLEEEGGSDLEYDQGETFNSETIDVDGAFDYREQMEQRRKRSRQKRNEKREMNRLVREEKMEKLQDRHSHLVEREKAKKRATDSKQNGEHSHSERKRIAQKAI